MSIDLQPTYLSFFDNIATVYPEQPIPPFDEKEAIFIEGKPLQVGSSRLTLQALKSKRIGCLVLSRALTRISACGKSGLLLCRPI